MPPDGPEFGELVADLEGRGLLQPIVLHDGRILDGHAAGAPAGAVASRRASTSGLSAARR
jgi:hypothetical protein